MLTKSEKTKEFIIQTVSPIFNKYGYAATSLNDITKATGLTKGAIYGNFKNKEKLAIATFDVTVKNMLYRIQAHQSKGNSALQKLFLITDFYRNYYDYTKEIGGCPILTMGVDAKNQNPLLFKHVQLTINKIQGNLTKIIQLGQEQNEIREGISANQYAKKIYTMITGAIFMTHTMEDINYLLNTIEQIDLLINNNLMK